MLPTFLAAALVVVVPLRTTVNPASQRYLQRALDEAEERGAVLVVVELDTPGGLLVSLREMTTAITTSATPVAVYVSPSGARAASAGFFLLLAADVAAMAPGTTTGAAHPVAVGGGGDEEDGESAAIDKVTEDAAALARSLARQRGRPAEPAEAAVTESRSYSEREAKELGLVDDVVGSRDELLAALDGRTVRRLGGAPATLRLRGVEVQVIRPTTGERLLMRIADPNIAYLLLLAGIIGLFVELTNPGLIIPGVVGGISFLLALYALSVLPVSAVGVLLLCAAFALFIAEAMVTSYGLLTVAGAVCFVIGSFMLVDTPIPSWRVSPRVVLPTAVVVVGTAAFLLTRTLRAHRVRALTGVEAMIGELGDAVTPLSPEGKVFVHGEYWEATAPRPVPSGARVRVVRVDHNRLWVEPAG